MSPAEATGGSGSEPGRVVAIVPAYNEEETLAEVVAALLAAPLIDRVVVVSDGSTDGTAEVASALGVQTLRLAANRGKGYALSEGVGASREPLLVFVDADISNLSDYLLQRLVEPVLSGGSAMNIGLRNRGWLNPWHRRFGPHLSGIRCLRREIFDAVPEPFLAGYRVEVALNWACRELGLELTTTVLYRLKHRVKEKKQGLSAGLRARGRMFREVFTAWLELRFRHPSPVPGGGRAASDAAAEKLPPRW